VTFTQPAHGQPTKNYNTKFINCHYADRLKTEDIRQLPKRRAASFPAHRRTEPTCTAPVTQYVYVVHETMSESLYPRSVALQRRHTKFVTANMLNFRDSGCRTPLLHWHWRRVFIVLYVCYFFLFFFLPPYGRYV